MAYVEYKDLILGKRLCLRSVLALVFVIATLACADGGTSLCIVKEISWDGDRSELDESVMANSVGKPCDTWGKNRKKLIEYYENHGFIAARLDGLVDSSGKLLLKLDRGLGWVWAPAENLDSSGTRPDVFRRLSGLVEGDHVSLLDLKRSERRLARIGYFEQTSDTKLFRDPVRNKIIPAFSMRKANVSEAEAMLSYSSEENSWDGLVNVNLYNIAGTARDLLVEGFSGKNSRNLSGHYKEPWIFGTAWNVVLRGSFDEVSFVEDSVLERVIVGELGVVRDLGFDISIGVYLGVSEDDKHSVLEFSYVSLDRFILPRSGFRVEGSATWKLDRPDSLDDYLSASLRSVGYFPMPKNFIVRYSAAVGGIFPTAASLKRMDYFALGGMDDFKGLRYHALRSRSYGVSEMALLWQDGHDLSIEVFYLPGLYRKRALEHGWGREHEYGFGFTQYRKSWNVNLYYALRNGCDFLDGIIGFGVKTLF